jgi:parallel beta-helix repeat protein
MLARKIIVGMVLVVCAVVIPVRATTYYVDPNGSDDSNGLSWATAFKTIQKGIDTSSDSNTVEVNEGTYYENVNFGGKTVTVHGADLAATVINGNGATSTVTFGADSVATLSGFTVTGGTRGVYCEEDSQPVVNNCIIRNNSGEGIYAELSTVTIKNSIIYGNNEGITLQDVESTIRNNTIVNNTSYGIRVSDGNGPTISNCILWNNGGDLSGCSATYSCIKNGDSGTGNISSYPYFEDYDGNDFHLTWNSPCINRGDPNGTYTGENDIDGENRVADEEYVSDCVDMGADEFNLHNINLVQNPGFENGTDANGTPLHWLKYNGYLSSVDSNEKHGGNCSWKFIKNGWAWTGGHTEYIPVEFGHTYKLTGWTKCDSATKKTYLSWIGLNADGNTLEEYNWKYGSPGLIPWTPYGGLHAIRNKNTEDIKITFDIYDPALTTGTVWWDDFSLVEEVEYLPPYGCENEPNAKTVNFGGTETNINWISAYNSVGTHWSDVTGAMGDPCTDPDDNNINYRTTKVGRTMVIEFPAFNNDANGLPLTPMLLEIMFKDTTDVTGFVVRSKIGHINPDPNYDIIDPNDEITDGNDRDKDIAHLGDCNDGRWKYVQYAFQKSDFQLLRAIDGKFTIKIYSPWYSGGIPINYVSLRAITQEEYEAFANKQRAMRGFYEIEMPANNPDNPSYADPSLTVFVRDIMHPVYQHTKPDVNEPNNISTFSAWGEIEPACFSIYSEKGLADLKITVSDLTHGGSVITNSNITAYHVVYDEKRLGDTQGIRSYSLLQDRIEEFNSLSIEPNTSESVWLKIHIPDEANGLAGGLYQGQVTIERNDGEPNYVPIEVYIYDITLSSPARTYPVFMDNYLSDDRDVVFNAVAETGFDPVGGYYSGLILHIDISTDPCKPHSVVFDDSNFLEDLNDAKAKGFAKNMVLVWLDEWYSIRPIYSIVMPSDHNDYNHNDPNLYAHLSEPNFANAFGALVEEYIKIGDACDINFIFFLVDEPGNDPYRRILTDRLANIMKDPRYVDPCIGGPYYKVNTTVSYYASCDEECLPGDYNVPTANHKIPPLINLVDYKIWPIYGLDGGYAKHQAPDYNGQFGYYTTHYSQLRNPVYNRFLHGLFALRTEAKMVIDWKMGGGENDPYNDFDGEAGDICPFTYPDFIYTYPSWSGKLHYIIGGLEAIREGIKDGRYIATLEKLIAEEPNNAAAQAAQDYLDDLKDRVDPNYNEAYEYQSTELGHYEAILKKISETSDPNDYEVFTRVRRQIAEYIGLLADGTDYKVRNATQNKFYTTIQAGIDDANDGDELLVAKRTHYGSLDLCGKDITLRGFDPNDWGIVAETIIDANGANNGVVFGSGEGNSSVLTGLTIKGAVNGIDCNSSSPTISKCVIRDNSSAGAYCVSGSPDILNNKIYSNGSYGINLSQTGSNTIVKNNLIYDDANGIYLDNPQGAAAISNNTIVDNTAKGICKSSGTAPTITNCIVWNNGDDLYDCTATYSCIKDCNDANGNGNICGDGNDPCFIDAESNDFHISIHSPCVSAGDPNGSYTGQTDIDGEARVMDGRVEMGADEAGFPLPDPFPNAHYWKLDETSGTIAYDSVGDTNGSFNGNDPCWVKGLIGGAIDCNGVSDYFPVPTLDTAYSSSSTFSVAGWFKTSQSTGKQTIVGQWAHYMPSPATLYFGWQVLVDTKKVVARFAGANPTITSDITGTSDVNDRNWHHFALVYPTQDSNAVLYVDGSSQGTPGNKTITTGYTKFRIGDGSYKVGSYTPVLKGGPFKGMIDDVMIYNRALTPGEVQQLYERGL